MVNNEDQLIQRVSKILGRSIEYENVYTTIEELCDLIDKLELGKPIWMK